MAPGPRVPDPIRRTGAIAARQSALALVGLVLVLLVALGASSLGHTSSTSGDEPGRASAPAVAAVGGFDHPALPVAIRRGGPSLPLLARLLGGLTLVLAAALALTRPGTTAGSRPRVAPSASSTAHHVSSAPRRGPPVPSLV